MKAFEDNKTMKELGIDGSREFVVVKDSFYFSIGDIIVLDEDDDTINPYFRRKGEDSHPIHLSSIAYKEQEEKKPQYIKFEEGYITSLFDACKKAEEMGWKKWGYKNALNFQGKGILLLSNDGDYLVSSSSEQQLRKDGWKEVGEKGEEMFSIGDKVVATKAHYPHYEVVHSISIINGERRYNETLCRGDEEYSYYTADSLRIPTEEELLTFYK